MTKIAHLTDRAVIRVSGDEAEKFLQGLVTADVAGAGPGRGIHAGLLTPQGKILFEFFLTQDDRGYLIDCAAAVAADLIKRLTFYKLRAAVDLEPLEGAKVWAVWDGPASESAGAIAYPDPRLPALGSRIIVTGDADANASGAEVREETDYHAHRISLGVPEGGRDFELGDAFPHEANFDQLGGVDFDKGCFVGQEVVSRMQHRGTARKRVVPVTANETLPGSGTEVIAGETPIGVLGSVAGAAGLALIRLDRAEKALAQGAELAAGGVAVRLGQPEWASFTVPGNRGEDAA